LSLQPGEKAGQEKRIHIIQGEYYVSDDPDVVITTLLGSCVAACIRDPVAHVGGMNHFLLPGHGLSFAPQDHASIREAERYGVYLMELLLNGILQRGGHRSRLEAKLFGGACTREGMVDIGAQNADFAEHFLHNEGIHIIGGSLRGSRGRRIQFWPVSGRARQVFLKDDGLVTAAPAKPLVQPEAGSIELF